VLTINESACRLLYLLLGKFAECQRPVLFTHVGRLSLLRRYLKLKLGARFEELFHSFEENDLALEWCEDQVLKHALPKGVPSAKASRKDYELLAGLSAAELGTVRKLLVRRSYRPGEVIINAGDKAGEIFFLAQGGVSVFTSQDAESRKRLATFSAGMVFGEMAAIDRAPRSAMIVADSPVTCDVLNLDAFEKLGSTHPGIKIKLLENLSLTVCRRLRTANRKLSVYD
jgi:glutaminase